MQTTQHRLLTTGNIDGFVSAILLKNLEMISDVTFVEEKDVKSGKIAISKNDITVNLPYTKDAHQAYDYHDSTSISSFIVNKHHILDTQANSVAEILFTLYHDKFKENTQLATLVQAANHETAQTLTTKERMHVYEVYENTFQKQAIEA